MEPVNGKLFMDMLLLSKFQHALHDNPILFLRFYARCKCDHERTNHLIRADRTEARMLWFSLEDANAEGRITGALFTKEMELIFSVFSFFRVLVDMFGNITVR
jgi:hypothetical protein